MSEEVIPDFLIPSVKDQLLQSRPGQYQVEKVFSVRELQDAIADANAVLDARGPSFLLDHFDVFFSIIVHGSKVELPIHVLGFEKMYKCLEMLVDHLDKAFDRNREPSAEDKPRLVTLSKMLAYLLYGLIRHVEVMLFHDATVLQTKQKKNSSKSDMENKWQDHMDRVLVLIYQWVNVPLEKLWHPPSAEASFVTTVADICYRIMERCKNAKDKSIRESIFQILGLLVKRYNHSMSCVVKIVQLVKISDGLAAHLANGVVQLIEETKCTGIVKEILREVDRATPEEGGMRNIGIFLETIAASKPELILPAVEDLTDHLADESYLMRNCVIGILGTVVKDVLTSEELTEEQKSQRDECLANLTDHLLDVNTFVRSKCLQVWQTLCSEGAVPLANQNTLLEATTLRLNDKSAIVRKYAFQLMSTLLYCNPFAGQLDQEKLASQLIDGTKKLEALRRRNASLSEPRAQIRTEIWNLLAPNIPKTIENLPAEDYSVKDKEEISDLDAEFENVRQLLLNEKIIEALRLLIKINTKLHKETNLVEMAPEAREAYLISLLYKTFMESQETQMEIDEDGEADRPNSRAKENQKRKAEYQSQVALVDYTKNCSTFAELLTAAIPVAKKRLRSVTATDAIGACSFLGIAYQFKVKGTKDAMREALCQIHSSEASVVENLADTYKQIYIGEDGRYNSDRQKAAAIVNMLTKLVKNLEPGQSPGLAKLITAWREKKILGTDVLQIMWERFSLRSADTSPDDSRVALMLLTMVGEKEPAVVRENLDVLLQVGLGPRSETDILLARDTCRALTKVRADNEDPLNNPFRFQNDHEIFVKLMDLLKRKYNNLQETCYVTFCVEAINAIYHLANNPEALMKDLLIDLWKKSGTAKENGKRRSISPVLLARLLTVVGHISIKEMAHSDTTVFKEMKRRNTLLQMAKENKKRNTNIRGTRATRNSEPNTPSSASRARLVADNSTTEDCGEEALEGATADDADAEFISHVLEHQVVTGNGLLAKFVPLVVDVCSHPERNKTENVQVAGALALAKMMTVSSEFCGEHLQLLMTILERSKFPSVRVNILIGLTDLMLRFPNEIEPWSQHIYNRLKDDSALVRRTCVEMLSNLILREMVRVKGQVSELAVCLVDQEAAIRHEATRVFTELSRKGNSLYNIMPNILSRLTDPSFGLEEDKFQHIISFILGLVQKEKQVDSIIEKVCVRFKLATTERQWRDLAYCLSLLKFNARGLRNLNDSLALMKDKVYYPPVLKVLQDIIAHAKKKVETKAACLELEENLERMLNSTEKESEKSDPETTDMPPPTMKPKAKKRRKSSRNASNRSE